MITQYYYYEPTLQRGQIKIPQFLCKNINKEMDNMIICVKNISIKQKDMEYHYFITNDMSKQHTKCTTFFLIFFVSWKIQNVSCEFSSISLFFFIRLNHIFYYIIKTGSLLKFTRLIRIDKQIFWGKYKLELKRPP